MSDEELKATFESGNYKIIVHKITEEMAALLDNAVGEPLIFVNGKLMKEKDIKENFLTVITYYHPDDKEFMGDYHSIEILDSTGVVVMNYGDHYHDKGSERAQGFIEGILWVYPQYRDRIGYIQKNLEEDSG